MTDYVAEGTFQTGATNSMTERSGAGVGVDTVPAGSTVLARNTGAGTHVITLVCNFTPDGLAVASRTHSLAAGTIKSFFVPSIYGDANGRVGMSVDATSSEVKYYILAT